jgi:hypothetical protein
MADPAGNSSSAPKASGPVQKYRFKVHTPDGAEFVSGILSVPLPTPLSSPTWSAPTAGAGEKVTCKVNAPGRDNEKIKFTFEKKDGKSWSLLDTAVAAVASGAATVERELPSLAPPQGGNAVDAILRFRAAGRDGLEVISAPFTLRADGGDDHAIHGVSFGHDGYMVTDAATVQLHGVGLEGAKVRFVLEKQNGGDWELIEDVFAVVKGGTASAAWKVPDAGEGKEYSLRVRALGKFAEQASPTIKVTPLPPTPFKTPQWSNSAEGAGAKAQHGDVQMMRVAAPGLDGKKVHFLVEHLVNGAWQRLATVAGEVRNGIATAPLNLKHPQVQGNKAPPQAGPAQVRFRAELFT